MQRNEGESFEEYNARRKESNRAVKALKRGVLFHDSAIYGTYYSAVRVDKKSKLNKSK